MKKFQHLVVFGDSLSDNGIDNGHGFLRNSNGRMWSEYLAELMELKSFEVRAWSGAMSGMGNYNPNAGEWSGLRWQVQNFMPTTAMNDTLVIVQIGTNDLHDPEMNITTEQVVANIIHTLEELSVKGARHLMLWNLNASLVSPGYIDQKYELFDYYKGRKDAATEQFKKFNVQIHAAVCNFNGKQNSMQVNLFDANSAIATIGKQFNDTTMPWRETAFFPKKGGWFWFDHWHYMTETHKYLSGHIFHDLHFQETK